MFDGFYVAVIIELGTIIGGVSVIVVVVVVNNTLYGQLHLNETPSNNIRFRNLIGQIAIVVYRFLIKIELECAIESSEWLNETRFTSQCVFLYVLLYPIEKLSVPYL